MKIEKVQEMDLNIGKPKEAETRENKSQLETKIVTQDPAILAIATSSYKIGRWYRMTLK